MTGKSICFLVFWLILLIGTIVEAIMGIPLEITVGECLALASLLIVYLTSRRR